METVRDFNNELSGLYEVKPPISRAKMANVTKCAIKAIRFYKHIVQSVEKFIQKCKPEYKVPGLYVIDSVVRQSRFQFGPQKDVFVPRFTRNIITTFQSLFKCPAEEMSKIVRVLNIWQTNEVFPSEIIQPLLDLAADPTNSSLVAVAQAAVDKALVVMAKNSYPQQQQQQQQQTEQNISAMEPQEDSVLSQSDPERMLATQNEMLNTVTHLLQQVNSGSQSVSSQKQQLQQLQVLQQQLTEQKELMQQPTADGAPVIDANLLAHVQALTNQLLQKTEPKRDAGGFNKKLLDFDYGESDDEEDRQAPEPDIQSDVQNILNDSSLMQQIHQVSQTIQKNNEYSAEISEQEHQWYLEQQQAEFDQQIAKGMPPPPLPFSAPPPMPEQQVFNDIDDNPEEQLVDEDFREHHQFKDRDDRDRREKKNKSEDRSRSRTPKRRKRSRSRERRRRSRSKESHKRSRSKERMKKEMERERKKKALPAVRANFVTICTTTIWIGHLNKFTSEKELKTELERFGTVDSISMVPPRGCAYVVMGNRQEAFKAIDRLKGYKLNGSSLKTAWAQSTSMRESEFKDSWDLDEGAMYLPWDGLPSDLSVFLDGAIIDVDSLPKHLQGIPTEKVKLEVPVPVSTTQSTQISTQMPPMMSFPGQPPMPPPPLPGQPPILGMMPPPPIQGMLPGMPPGMGMPIQRPMIPGLPPPAMPLTPGLAPPPNVGMPPGPPMTPGSTPSPIALGSTQIPALPGLRPPGVLPAGGSLNVVSSGIASTLAQTLQTIMSSTSVPGEVPSSPAAPPPGSTGFTPGGPPPNFGFNPSMPPPGFHIPPPVFGGPMRPMMPPGPMPPRPMLPSKPDELIGQMGARPPLMSGSSQKQAEMVWPPDSNENDEDYEEEDDITDADSDVQNMPVGQIGHEPALNRLPQGHAPPGHEQSHMRMLSPSTPGGLPQFPHGGPPKPMNQLWDTNRMEGPRQRGPLLGSRPNLRPPMGSPQMGDPRGPRMGDPRGPRMGDPRGPRMGDPRGPRMGDPRGPRMGDPRGPRMGDPRGPRMGDPRGPRMGDPRGPQMGDPRGPWMGDPRGPRMGDPRGPRMGDPRGLRMGDPRGPRMGDPRGPRIGDPRGPPFIGNMQGGQFQRFPNVGPSGPSPNIRGPVSLFDLNVEPSGDFEEEPFHEEEQEITENEYSEENSDRTFNEYNENVEENQLESSDNPDNEHPFNTWQSTNRNQSLSNVNQFQSRGDSFRGGGRDNRSYDRSIGSFLGGRDRDSEDRGRDHKNLHERERDRPRDWDRDRRDRERRDYSNREDMDRERGDRDGRRRDDRRDEQRDRDIGERPQDRERGARPQDRDRAERPQDHDRGERLKDRERGERPQDQDRGEQPKDRERGERPKGQDKPRTRKSRWGNWDEEIKQVETANKGNCLDTGENVSAGQQDASNSINDFETFIEADKNQNKGDTTEMAILGNKTENVFSNNEEVENFNVSHFDNTAVV